ncbi:MAG: hypothetical protein ACLFRT_13335, partial [Actinomycetota bacterium]
MKVDIRIRPSGPADRRPAGSSGWLRKGRSEAMSYIVQRQNRFYVVVYDGVNPTTGREQRRWHPAGHNRADAEAIAQRFEAAEHPSESPGAEQVTVGRYLTETWMQGRRR